MRWIPSLMRVTFQLIRKPMERPLSLIGPISTIERDFFIADKKDAEYTAQPAAATNVFPWERGRPRPLTYQYSIDSA
jgi:hypothetical protein